MEDKFKRRRDIKLSIPPYRESLQTSCGSACIMMIMAYYLNTPLNTQIENEIHANVKFSSYDVENGAKMIRYLRKNGFDVEYYINAERNFFENHPIEGIPSDIWHSMVEEFFSILEEEMKSGLKIVEDTTIENIVRNIEQKNPIICEIQLGGYITHSIVVRGISSNKKSSLYFRSFE